MMAAFGASDVVVRGRSRRGMALVIGLLLPLAASAFAEATDHEPLMTMVGLLVAVEAIAFLFLPAIAPNGIAFLNGERRGALRADREGITFRGRVVLARAQIRNVAVQARTGGSQSVQVSAIRRKHDLHVDLQDEEKARALVAALDLDADRHVATFSVEEDPLRSRARWLAARAAILAGGLGVTLTVLGFARRNELLLLAVVPALLVYALLVPRARLSVDLALGADGITLRHRGRLRSIALSAIGELRSAKNTATLRLLDGEELVLRFGRDADEEAAVQHAAFALRMRQALVRRDRAHDPSEALLARGQRDGAVWSRELLALARPADGYRVAALPEETLWRIAEGSTAEPTARVGALVALRSRFDDDARERLQSLASRTAQRDLRAALEAAADGAEPDAIIAAYDRVSRS